MTLNGNYRQLFKSFRGICRFDEPMSKHSSYGIGGNADVFLIPAERDELTFVLKTITENRDRVYFIGSGSNILFSDEGIQGVVISLKGTFNKLRFDSPSVYSGAGVMLGHLVKEAARRNLSGLESLAGVPGTLGGALYMNAGAYGQEISNYLVSANVTTLKGHSINYSREDLQFQYRRSSFRTDEIITGAVFKLIPDKKELIDQRRRQASAKRRKNQPLKYRSAGSVFKNQEDGTAAGYLIDKAGLKGRRIGDAEISCHHANFFINHGNAKAADVVELIRLARQTVNDKFGVDLELEIKLIGFSQEEFQA